LNSASITSTNIKPNISWGRWYRPHDGAEILIRICGRKAFRTNIVGGQSAGKQDEEDAMDGSDETDNADLGSDANEENDNAAEAKSDEPDKEPAARSQGKGSSDAGSKTPAETGSGSKSTVVIQTRFDSYRF
jgi:hypothetical protein